MIDDNDNMEIIESCFMAIIIMLFGISAVIGACGFIGWILGWII